MRDVPRADQLTGEDRLDASLEALTRAIRRLGVLARHATRAVNCPDGIALAGIVCRQIFKVPTGPLPDVLADLMNELERKGSQP